MTIDERLEKLTERHEALAQTVEITAGMHKANEERMANLMTIVLGHERRFEEVDKRHDGTLTRLEGLQASNERRFAEIGDRIDTLVSGIGEYIRQERERKLDEKIDKLVSDINELGRQQRERKTG